MPSKEHCRWNVAEFNAKASYGHGLRRHTLPGPLAPLVQQVPQQVGHLPLERVPRGAEVQPTGPLPIQRDKALEDRRQQFGAEFLVDRQREFS